MDQMLEFYSTIRADKSVQELGREKDIREIADLLIKYTESANLANYTLNDDYVSLEPDKRDIQEIAYNAGMYDDAFTRFGKAGKLFRYFFAYKSPLDDWVMFHELSYSLFRDHNIFSVLMLKDNLHETYNAIILSKKGSTEKAEALDELLDYATDHAIRKFTLVGLASSADAIMNLDRKNKIEAYNRILHGDLSGLVYLGHHNELDNTKIDELMNYLLNQAIVNGLRSKTAHLLYLRSINRANSVELAEWTQEIISDEKNVLKKPGWIRNQLKCEYLKKNDR